MEVTGCRLLKRVISSIPRRTPARPGPLLHLGTNSQSLTDEQLANDSRREPRELLSLALGPASESTVYSPRSCRRLIRRTPPRPPATRHKAEPRQHRNREAASTRS